MKVTVKSWHAVAQWRWDTGTDAEEGDGEGDGAEGHSVDVLDSEQTPPASGTD